MSKMLNALSEADRKTFHFYLEEYGNDSYSCMSALPFDQLDCFLRFWKEKTALFEMFGENLILERPISYTKPYENIHEEIEDLCYGRQYRETPIQRFVNEYHTAVNMLFYGHNGYVNYNNRNPVATAVHNFVYSDVLATNRYNGESVTIPAEYTKNGRPIQVPTNSKAIRMLGKLCKELKLNTFNEDEFMQGYEALRIAHSQILNQKYLEGTLCLSIHPMDYVTMSDNDSGWSSCMRWMCEPGEYRIGTLEMMNSPYVVVAYLKDNNNNLGIGNDYNYNLIYWNNKLWRQLIIVTPELILGNRQYPYANDEIEGVALSWMRELAMTAGYGVYRDTVINLHNYENTHISDTQTVRVCLRTEMMYNDISNNNAYINDDRFAEINFALDLNISGPAVCVHCGDVIDYHNSDDSGDIVYCNRCYPLTCCYHCGSRIAHGDEYDTADGVCLCSYCYDEHTVYCNHCNRTVYSEMEEHIHIRWNANDESSLNFEDSNLEFHGWDFWVCASCLQQLIDKGQLPRADNRFWGGGIIYANDLDCAMVQTLYDIDAIDQPYCVYLENIVTATNVEELMNAMQSSVY